MSQENKTLSKAKRLPCNKKYLKKEKKVISKTVRKSPACIRKKISSSIATKVKKAGLYNAQKRSKYIDIPEMVHNIELQFNDKMNWANYGVYWDIDHIIPQYLFDFTCEDQVKACWSIENIRPLIREDNAKKANKLNMDLIREYGLQHILKKII